MNTVEPTYFTTSDTDFFPGTVGLINSLRLTGNAGEVVVYDVGLSNQQRDRLSTIATVEAPPLPPEVFRRMRAERRAQPKFLPPPDRTRGPIVLIDSDMLVVASLRHMFEEVDRGKIALFHDPDDRWFEAWQEQFALKAPLRRGQRYANSGFVAFQVERWPWLLERWTEAVGRIPRERLLPPELDPFRDPDQDALNAVLMSEVPAGSVVVQPEWAQAHPDAMPRVRIVNERELTCTDEGREVVVLHHSLKPKTWESRGWRRDARQAYVWLLPRVLCGDDVPLRLEPDELPLWLRPTARGRRALRGLEIGYSTPGLWFGVRVVNRARRVLRGMKRRWRPGTLSNARPR